MAPGVDPQVASLGAYRRRPGDIPPVGIPPALLARLSVPRLPAAHVPRPRLENRLTELAPGGATLLTAGPGEGKTALVAGWAHAGPTPGTVAWLTLDDADSDPATFFTAVLAALRWTGVPLGDGGPRPLTYPDGTAEAHVDRIHALLYELPVPLVLVLDGIHLVRDRSVLRRLDALLTRPPPALRLVLLGRRDPGLSLHRLRLDGLLGEVPAPDLRFDRGEANLLLRAHGLRLDAAQTDRLLRRTGGWAAGLRLAAMSIDRSDPAPGVARFAGDAPPVADYLTAEVMAPLPAAVRTFLLRTSVADRLDGTLATALSGRPDGRRLLAELAAQSRLVAADPRRAGYHDLLREYLYHRLLVEDPDAAADAHRRAARWYGEHRAPVPALRHAVLSGDADEVGRVLFTAALPYLFTSDGARIADTVAALAGTADAAPSLVTLACAAVVELRRHDVARARGRLRRARAALPGVPAAVRAAADLGLSLLDAAVATSPDAARAASVRVLARTGPDTVCGVPALAEYRAVARWMLGTAQLWLGAVGAAGVNLREAAAVAGACGLDVTARTADAYRAVIDVVRGELRTGTRRALATLATAEPADPGSAAALLALALAELQQDHPDLAARYLVRAATAAGTDRTLAAAVRVAEARLRVQAGDPNAARRLVTELRADTGLPALLADWLRGVESEAELAAGAAGSVLERLRPRTGPGDWDRIWLGWADLALRRPDRARQRVAPLHRSAGRGRAVSIEESLITALAADAQRQDGAAVDAVDRALGLAAADGLSHPFRVAGDRLVPLVRRHQRLIGTYAEFAGTLLDDGPGAPVARPVEPLTDRELTVLRYLPTLSSNDEIAADLHISVNTVKAHLKSLYRKLAVTNRRAAIRRGRLLGLLRPAAPDGAPPPREAE